MRAIARELNRAPSTISREVARNGGAVRYLAASADQATWKRAARPKLCRLAIDAKLTKIIAKKLKRFCSPQQIAGWLKRRYPDDEGYHMSHEAIGALTGKRLGDRSRMTRECHVRLCVQINLVCSMGVNPIKRGVRVL